MCFLLPPQLGTLKIFQSVRIYARNGTGGPRIARIRTVRFHYSAVLFLVQKYSNSAIPHYSAITKAKNGIQIVLFPHYNAVCITTAMYLNREYI